MKDCKNNKSEIALKSAHIVCVLHSHADETNRNQRRNGYLLLRRPIIDLHNRSNVTITISIRNG